MPAPLPRCRAAKMLPMLLRDSAQHAPYIAMARVSARAAPPRYMRYTLRSLISLRHAFERHLPLQPFIIAAAMILFRALFRYAAAAPLICYVLMRCQLMSRFRCRHALLCFDDTRCCRADAAATMMICRHECCFDAAVFAMLAAALRHALTRFIVDAAERCRRRYLPRSRAKAVRAQRGVATSPAPGVQVRLMSSIAGSGATCECAVGEVSSSRQRVLLSAATLATRAQDADIIADATILCYTAMLPQLLTPMLLHATGYAPMLYYASL